MVEERFLSLTVIQRELALSSEQVLELITDGRLPAIRLFGSWRVERRLLEQFISREYEVAERLLRGEEQRNAEATPAPIPKKDAIHLGDTRPKPALPDLTPQMTRVLHLVAQGLSNAEIAEELSVEVSTVKSHVSRLLARLEVRDRAHLVALAWRSGVMQADD
jgi:DNA-binding NarL/FixJ family response regulator